MAIIDRVGGRHKCHICGDHMWFHDLEPKPDAEIMCERCFLTANPAHDQHRRDAQYLDTHPDMIRPAVVVQPDHLYFCTGNQFRCGAHLDEKTALKRDCGLLPPNEWFNGCAVCDDAVTKRIIKGVT